jgi:topoisomerase IV subunit A
MSEDEDKIIPSEDENNEESIDSTIDEGFEDIVSSGGNHFYENDENTKIPLPKLQECTKIGFWIMLRM